MTPTDKAKAMADCKLLPVLRAAQRCLARDLNDKTAIGEEEYPTSKWIAALEQECVTRNQIAILPDGWNLGE